MRIGPAIVVFYFLVFVVSLAMPVIAARRHGWTRRAAPAILAPIGALMSYALLIVYLGWVERDADPRSISFWIGVAVGLLGVAMMFVGWRAALRRPYPPGACRRCGYDLAGLKTCPECGGP